MNSPTYRTILRILERWPLDETKAGRDFGEFIRQQTVSHFSITKSGQINLNVWNEINTRLSRIESDNYKNLFHCSQVASSTGMTEEECKITMSNETMAYFEEKNKTALGRMGLNWATLKYKFAGTKSEEKTEEIKQDNK